MAFGNRYAIVALLTALALGLVALAGCGPAATTTTTKLSASIPRVSRDFLASSLAARLNCSDFIRK